jgi:hypothetical protein
VVAHSPSGVSPTVKKCRSGHGQAVPTSRRVLSFNVDIQKENEPACTSSCVEDSENGSPTLENTVEEQNSKNEMNIDERMKGFMDLSGTATVVKVSNNTFYI